MKRKRLDRDIDWGFQYFPYYQLRLDAEGFHGLASMIDIISGEEFCWDFERAGKAPVSGGGMKWLQLIPDGKSRLITAMYKPDGALSVCYIDIIERIEFDPNGWAIADCMFGQAIESSAEYQTTLQSLYVELRDKLVTCKPEEFDALYEDYAQQYADAGYAEITEERKEVYEAGLTTKLPE